MKKPAAKSEPEILDNLPSELRDIAKDIPPDKLRTLLAITWSGPLPPPGVLKQYPPEVRKVIVDNATAQMKHRHKIESKVVASNIKNSGRGMIFAFILTIAMVVLGTYLIAIGKSAEGLASIFVPTGLQAGNFLLQRFRGFNKIRKDTKTENEHSVKSK